MRLTKRTTYPAPMVPSSPGSLSLRSRALTRAPPRSRGWSKSSRPPSAWPAPPSAASPPRPPPPRAARKSANLENAAGTTLQVLGEDQLAGLLPPMSSFLRGAPLHRRCRCHRSTARRHPSGTRQSANLELSTKIRRAARQTANLEMATGNTEPPKIKSRNLL